MNEDYKKATPKIQCSDIQKKEQNLSVSEKVEENMECVCVGLIKKRKQGIYLIKKYRNKNKYVTTIKK